MWRDVTQQLSPRAREYLVDFENCAGCDSGESDAPVFSDVQVQDASFYRVRDIWLAGLFR